MGKNYSRNETLQFEYNRTHNYLFNLSSEAFFKDIYLFCYQNDEKDHVIKRNY